MKNSICSISPITFILAVKTTLKSWKPDKAVSIICDNKVRFIIQPMSTKRLKCKCLRPPTPLLRQDVRGHTDNTTLAVSLKPPCSFTLRGNVHNAPHDDRAYRLTGPGQPGFSLRLFVCLVYYYSLLFIPVVCLFVCLLHVCFLFSCKLCLLILTK